MSTIILAAIFGYFILQMTRMPGVRGKNVGEIMVGIIKQRLIISVIVLLPKGSRQAETNRGTVQ